MKTLFIAVLAFWVGALLEHAFSERNCLSIEEPNIITLPQPETLVAQGDGVTVYITRGVENGTKNQTQEESN